MNTVQIYHKERETIVEYAMSVNDSTVGHSDEDQTANGALELLTDDEEVWTVVPVEADGDDRLTQWMSVECELLCDLAEWR